MSQPLPLHLTETAEDDLAEIWFHVASEASAKTADRLVADIQAACQPTRRFPLLGAQRELLAPLLRVIFHRPYAVYYMPEPDRIVIVRVLHGGRDIAAIAEQGGFDA